MEGGVEDSKEIKEAKAARALLPVSKLKKKRNRKERRISNKQVCEEEQLAVVTQPIEEKPLVKKGFLTIPLPPIHTYKRTRLDKSEITYEERKIIANARCDQKLYMIHAKQNMKEEKTIYDFYWGAFT